jgi:AcrR family transcriptional regulator
MTTPAHDHPSNTDGRRARRARGQAAVIDAMFDLIIDGHSPPRIDEVAARSGLSQASIYRYFGSLDELQSHTLEHFVERYAHLLGPPPTAHTTSKRITAHITHRMDLLSTAGAVMWLGRVRAFEQPRIATGVRDLRRRLREHTSAHFAADLVAADDADVVIDAIESTTSLESWTTLRTVHDRDVDTVRAVWTLTLCRLLDVENHDDDLMMRSTDAPT